jgi:cell wall-associated NlpC family hydrolase
VKIGIYIDGRHRRTAVANRSNGVDKAGGRYGRHSFAITLSWPKRAHKISLIVHAADAGRRERTDVRAVAHRTPKGELIVSIARHYVGARYVYGAAGPHAFDCSGYAMFVYRKARVASLPHNAEAQRRTKHMRRIARSAARPGDLVFYMSGGGAYHVSIYAGHGEQYSAVDPGQGVRHYRIDAGNVRYETDWH